MKNFQNIFHKIINFLLPPRCVPCGVFVDQHGAVCAECWNKLKFITKPSCKICDEPFEFKIDEEMICASCLTEKPHYNAALSVVAYEENSANLVSKFKYQDATYLTSRIADWLIFKGKNLIEECDFIAPVPLHRFRLFTRKYNQSALLAQYIARKTNKIYLPDLLIRTRNTTPQAGLDRKIRLKNLKKAFILNSKYQNDIKGKNILIIDDVITTGTTVNICARILKRKKAAKVFVLSFAKTLRIKQD